MLRSIWRYSADGTRAKPRCRKQLLLRWVKQVGMAGFGRGVWRFKIWQLLGMIHSVPHNLCKSSHSLLECTVLVTHFCFEVSAEALHISDPAIEAPFRVNGRQHRRRGM